MAKKNKCCGLPWLSSKCECTLNDILLKLLPEGHPAGNYEIVSDGDGNYNIVSSSSSNPPVPTFVDNENGTATFNNGVTPPVTFDSKISTFTDNEDGTYTLKDDFGNTITIDTNDVLTSYTATVTDHKIGEYTDEDGNPTDVFESLTKLSQSANGDITYKAEDGLDSTVKILSTDANQLLKSGTDYGNLLRIVDINSTDPDNTIVVGLDGKLKVLPVIAFPDDQVLAGIQTDTTTTTFVPLPPNPEGQVDYNLEVDVKTQCEIDFDVNGIKLADSFYENIGTAHLINLGTAEVFDPSGELLEANVVKDGCSLKVFVNKPSLIFYKDHGVADLNLVTDVTVAGKAPDIISIVLTNATADIDLSNWYANILTSGKKVNQKIIIALNIGTPLYALTFDHGNTGLVKSIYDEEILTVRSVEANILYED